MIKNTESLNKMKNIRKALDVLSSKWMMIIISAISKPSRYKEIAKRIPDVQSRTLQDKLNVLIQKGFVIKKNYAGKNPYIEYILTPSGEEAFKLASILEKIGKQL